MDQTEIRYKLLSLFRRLPKDGSTLKVIFREFENAFKKEMSARDFQTTSIGEIRWKHSLREEIIQCDISGLLIVMTSDHWQITERGHQWVNECEFSSTHNISSFPEVRNQQIAREINHDNKATIEGTHIENHLLETFNDFSVPLMRILDSLPNRMGKSGDVIKLFERNYGVDIAPFQYTKNQSGFIRWVHNVHWNREKLKQIGMIDAPQVGIWRLTDEGHQWLVKHSDATHLSTMKPKSTQKENQSPQTLYHAPRALKEEFKDWFLTALQEKLTKHIQTIAGTVHFEYIKRSNYLQIRFDGYSGCHYEILLRRLTLEVALHFEGSAKRSQARLRSFEPHLDDIRRLLYTTVRTGNFQGKDWTRLYVERSLEPFSQELLLNYCEFVSRFVKVTFPVMQEIYKYEKAQQGMGNKEELSPDLKIRRILDQEIAIIQAYLQGRSQSQPSDENLCEWINFCYTFEMYDEGKDLFSYVSKTEVNPWYYERTKKIVKVCEQKVDLMEKR